MSDKVTALHSFGQQTVSLSVTPEPRDTPWWTIWNKVYADYQASGKWATASHKDPEIRKFVSRLNSILVVRNRGEEPLTRGPFALTDARVKELRSKGYPMNGRTTARRIVS